MAYRVGIMTFLHNDNYGSTLQAWALQKTICGLGYAAEHIDYKPSQIEKIRNLVTSGNSPRLVLEGLRKRAVKAGNAGARSKAASFAPFYQEQMTLSPVCADHAALKKQAETYDLLLCGSDQIWSPVWLNPAYFLNFAGKNQPRIAYAASMGVKSIGGGKKARRMAGLVEGFSAVSLREEEGAAIIEKLSGQAVPVMPDPVCLPERRMWQQLAKHPQRKHPYLLCYFIGDDPSYWQRVAAISARTGLRVKVIPVTENAYRQPYDLADGLSPQEWLGWLDEAAYLCTDSFHGAMFASILQTPFAVFRRYRDDDPESKNSRIDNLMRELGLDADDDDIPWEQVAARLDGMRRRGIAWLKASLDSAAAELPGSGETEKPGEASHRS